MWSKLHKNRDHGRQTSGHLIVENPSGQPVLQTTSGNPLPPKGILKNLPALPSEATDTANETRVTSSIYSHDDSGVRFADGNMPPTSPILNYAEYSRYAEDEEHDVSPPDTPIDLHNAKRYSDVSPIESNGHFFADAPKQKTSHLPVRKPRRSSAFGNDAPELPKGAPSHQTKLFGNQGLEGASGRSAEAPRSGSPLDARSREGSKLFSAGKERLQMFSKARDQRQRDPKQKQPREQWKGASGRFPLVAPIDTKPSAKNNKQVRPHAQRDTETNPHGHLGHRPDTYTITTVSVGNPIPEKPRSKAGQFRLRSRTASPAARGSPKEPEAVMKQNASPVIESTTTDMPTNQSPVQFGEVESPTPTGEKSEEPNISDMFHGLNVAHEPRSRFSASTYAPTEAAITPPGSSHDDAPPVPFIGGSPIMTRRRPIPSSSASIKSMKRKPVSSDSPPMPEVDMKSLSPEEQAQRRVDSLEARRKQLSLRKDSIKTMLHELTEVIQPSSIAYDMATRDEVKKTVSSLRTELDDIGKEDHDIGLKLVRLYKNLDNAADYEHSTLWVKRVTS